VRLAAAGRPECGRWLGERPRARKFGYHAVGAAKLRPALRAERNFANRTRWAAVQPRRVSQTPLNRQVQEIERMRNHNGEYTKQQREEFKRKFAKKRRIENIVGLFTLVLPVLCLVLAVCSSVAAEQIFQVTLNTGMLLPLGVPLFIVILIIMPMCGFFISLLNWRCPACGAGLARNLVGRAANTRVRCCSKCGVELQ
jgi:hypothetical protein